MGIITYNGISSMDVGVVVERHPNYVTPSKEYEKIHVPGRNGDVILFTGAYSNVDRTYDIAFGSHEKNHPEMARAVSEWLYSADDYVELYDSYEPDVYRMAVYKDGTDFENVLNHLGRATITFDCKPQRFLRSGKYPVTFTKSGFIRNPTQYTALPIIRVYKGASDGVLSFGGYSCTISKVSGWVVINCEIQEFYYNNISTWRPYLTLTNGFPKLKPGLTDIVFDGSITQVEVVPKWWTI